MQETGSNKQFAKLLETVEAGLSLVKQVVYDGLNQTDLMHHHLHHNTSSHCQLTLLQHHLDIIKWGYKRKS